MVNNKDTKLHIQEEGAAPEDLMKGRPGTPGSSDLLELVSKNHLCERHLG